MSHTEMIERLAEYKTRHPEEREAISKFEAFLRGEPNCFRSDCWTGHVTGSAWVVNGQRSHVLLTHHRKLDRWLQLGGHSDGDADTLRVAWREASEESGLAVEPLSEALFDIDIHLIPANRSDPVHLHFDARFAFVVTGEQPLRVSDESHALRWVEIDRLADVTAEFSMQRMAAKWLTNRDRYV